MKANFCGRTRREFLWQTGAGFTGVALAGMLDRPFFGQSALAADGAKKVFANPLAPKKPHFDAPAKSVIFLYMYGGPSHIDTFDYKPSMIGRDNQTIAVKTFGRGARRTKVASSSRAGSSNNTASAVTGSASCFRISPSMSMTLRSCTR